MSPDTRNHPEDCENTWGRRADDHLSAFKELLMSHTSEEMEKYEKMIQDIDALKREMTDLTNKIDDNDAASINRHEATQERIKCLTDSINAYMEHHSQFIESIRRAFPRDADNRPDYDGHNRAHLSWIADAQEAKDFKKFLKQTILGAAALALCSFVAIATWAAFLKGPV
jgi:anion-transporting  ArsA/GET3 family ATPase